VREGGFGLVEHSMNDPAKGGRIVWIAPPTWEVGLFFDRND
jgi:hypothetical protein